MAETEKGPKIISALLIHFLHPLSIQKILNTTTVPETIPYNSKFKVSRKLIIREVI